MAVGVIAEHALASEKARWDLQLHSGDGRRTGAWRLTVPLSSSPEVEICEAAVRLHIKDCNSSDSLEEVLEIKVPAHAQPIDTHAVRVSFSQKRNRLVVDWPQTGASDVATPADELDVSLDTASTQSLDSEPCLSDLPATPTQTSDSAHDAAWAAMIAAHDTATSENAEPRFRDLPLTPTQTSNGATDASRCENISQAAAQSEVCAGKAAQDPAAKGTYTAAASFAYKTEATVAAFASALSQPVSHSEGKLPCEKETSANKQEAAPSAETFVKSTTKDAAPPVAPCTPESAAAPSAVPRGISQSTAEAIAGTSPQDAQRAKETPSSSEAAHEKPSEETNHSSEEWRRRGAEAAKAGNFEDSASCYSASRKARAEEWHSRGNDAVKEGNFEAAVTCYSAAMAAGHSDAAVLRANRAHCLSKLEKHTEAVEDALHCIKLRPDYVKAYFRGAMSMHALGRSEDALDLLRRAPAGDKAIAKWILALSQELAQKGNMSFAQELAEKATQNGSSNGAASNSSQPVIKKEELSAPSSSQQAGPGTGEAEDVGWCTRSQPRERCPASPSAASSLKVSGGLPKPALASDLNTPDDSEIPVIKVKQWSAPSNSGGPASPTRALPTKSVSGFLVSDEETAINVYLPLEKLFHGARDVFTDEQSFHMDVKEDHLSVHFVGPRLKHSSEQVCWAMSVALPHEVDPAKATLKLRNGKVSIKLPKAVGTSSRLLQASHDQGDEEDEEDKEPVQMAGPQAQPKPEMTPRLKSTPEVESLREQGNQHFKTKAYADAKRCYTEALAADSSNPSLMSNRAAASLMLCEWQDACEDSRAAAALSVSSGKINERCVRCLLLCDRLQDAMDFCGQALSAIGRQQAEQDAEWKTFVATAHRISHHAGLVRNIAALLVDKQEASQGQTAAQGMLKQLDDMLCLLSETEMASPWGFRLRLCKVKAHLHPVAGRSGQPAETRDKWATSAVAEIDKLFAEKPGDADVLHWRARAYLRKGRRTDARASLKEAMRVTDGDHAPSEDLSDTLRVSEKNKEQGNAAFQRREWQSACQHYDAAIQADHLRLDSDFSASLHCNRSAAKAKLGQTLRAMEDVTAALAIMPKYTKALFRRAMLYMELERYQNAAHDFDRVAELAPNFVGLATNRTRAKRWSQQPPARNHYAVLGIGFDASASDIKKAYRAAALKWHPDKNRDKGEKADKMFKDVQEAWEVLSDPERRQEFDNPEPQFSHRFFNF